MAKSSNKEVTNDDIMQMLSKFADSVDERFVSIEERFDAIDMRLFRIESGITEMKQDIVDLKASHDRLLNTVDRLIARIDRYEVEQAARDSQFEKLLAWARKVSAKTGIPLENL